MNTFYIEMIDDLKDCRFDGKYVVFSYVAGYDFEVESDVFITELTKLWNDNHKIKIDYMDLIKTYKES